MTLAARLAIALVFAFVAILPCQATTIELHSFEEMCQQADQIVHGRIVDSHVEREGPKGPIWTTYTLEVIESLLPARKEGARIPIRQLGGQIGDERMEAVGFPHFAVGEEVILFTKDYGNGSQQVHNAWQGCLRVSPAVPASAGKAAQPARLPEAEGLMPGAGTSDLAAFKALVKATLPKVRKGAQQ